MGPWMRHLWQSLLDARPTVLAALLFLMGICLGASGGLASALLWNANDVPFAIASTSPAIPTVIIEAAPGGKVEGRIGGEARLLLGNDLVANGSGAFAGVMRGSLPITVEVPVPPGMKYVASKSGKKFYAVTSAMGNRILPKNRVYFPDAASAKAAGFLP